MMRVFYKFCRETTVHGLGHIVKERPIMFQVTWMIVFIVCLIASIASIVDTVMKYKSKPMAVDQQILSESKLPYPEFTMCTRNRFLATNARRYNISDDLMRILDRAYYYQTFSPAELALMKKVKPEYNAVMKKNNFTNFGDLALALMPTCSNVMKHCSSGGLWKNTSHPEQVDVNVIRVRHCCSMITKFLINDGTCFQLKGLRTPENRRDTLRLVLGFPNVSDYYLTDLQFEDFASYTLDSSDQLVTYMEPAHQKTRYVNNPRVYKCNPAPDYNIVECRLNCSVSRQAQISCNCQPAIEAVRKLNTVTGPDGEADFQLPTEAPRICSPWELEDCFQSRIRANKSLLNLSFRHCKTICPDPCVSMTYDFKTVSTPFDINIVRPKVKFNETLVALILRLKVQRRMREATITASFSTEADHYMFIRQYETMSFGTVLSCLGGQLGFFLGCSLITVVHVVVFIVYNCCNYVNPKKRFFTTIRMPPPAAGMANNNDGNNNNNHSNTPAKISTTIPPPIPPCVGGGGGHHRHRRHHRYQHCSSFPLESSAAAAICGGGGGGNRSESRHGLLMMTNEGEKLGCIGGVVGGLDDENNGGITEGISSILRHHGFCNPYCPPKCVVPSSVTNHRPYKYPLSFDEGGSGEASCSAGAVGETQNSLQQRKHSTTATTTTKPLDVGHRRRRHFTNPSSLLLTNDENEHQEEENDDFIDLKLLKHHDSAAASTLKDKRRRRMKKASYGNNYYDSDNYNTCYHNRLPPPPMTTTTTAEDSKLGGGTDDDGGDGSFITSCTPAGVAGRKSKKRFSLNNIGGNRRYHRGVFNHHPDLSSSSKIGSTSFPPPNGQLKVAGGGSDNAGGRAGGSLRSTSLFSKKGCLIVGGDDDDDNNSSSRGGGLLIFRNGGLTLSSKQQQQSPPPPPALPKLPNGNNSHHHYGSKQGGGYSERKGGIIPTPKSKTPKNSFFPYLLSSPPPTSASFSSPTTNTNTITSTTPSRQPPHQHRRREGGEKPHQHIQYRQSSFTGPSHPPSHLQQQQHQENNDTLSSQSHLFNNEIEL